MLPCQVCHCSVPQDCGDRGNELVDDHKSQWTEELDVFEDFRIGLFAQTVYDLFYFEWISGQSLQVLRNLDAGQTVLHCTFRV